MSQRSKILVVDDELSMREFLEIFFVQQGHDVDTASNGAVAIERFQQTNYDLVITDMKMPQVSGLEVLRACREKHPTTPVIVMTAFASTETAIQAMKAGAYDYFTKPFKLDAVKAVLDKALERRSLVQENQRLKAQLDQQNRSGALLGRSDAMRRVFDLVRRAATTRTNVLILGESGTGKELVARRLHELSDRRAKPFLVINCAAIPENLLESELFGHKRGSFTGATADQAGMFQAANGGTILLDEIGEMPQGMQAKLLRVLQERKIKAVGDHREIPVDVRVVAATNRDLKAEIGSGRFREDLYYRLNVIAIELPPLRERPTDVPLLATHFIRKYADEFAKPITDITAPAMQRLLRHPFSGNVRELENLIERAVALAEGSEITVAAFPAGPSSAAPLALAPLDDELPADGIDLDAEIEALERRRIGQALERTEGRKKDAARLLGISFRQLRYRLDKLKLGGNPADSIGG